MLVAAYDTELFGHWWFEGPVFLEHLFTLLADMDGVTPRSMSAARAAHPEPASIDLVAGSWGFRKDERSWVADETRHMWDLLGEIEAETVRLVEKHRDASGARATVLAQLVREALLAQASDWPFMVLRGRNDWYGEQRLRGHHERWEQLARALGNADGPALEREAVEMFAIDNVLPDLRPADVT